MTALPRIHYVHHPKAPKVFCGIFGKKRGVLETENPRRVTCKRCLRFMRLHGVAGTPPAVRPSGSNIVPFRRIAP